MRYFLFSYTWTGRGRKGHGNLAFGCGDGFPNRNDILRQAAVNSAVEDIVISGWTEFNSEQDYMEYIDDE